MAVVSKLRYDSLPVSLLWTVKLYIKDISFLKICEIVQQNKTTVYKWKVFGSFGEVSVYIS